MKTEIENLTEKQEAEEKAVAVPFLQTLAKTRWTLEDRLKTHLRGLETAIDYDQITEVIQEELCNWLSNEGAHAVQSFTEAFIAEKNEEGE